jgi:hypothetical protein
MTRSVESLLSLLKMIFPKIENVGLKKMKPRLRGVEGKTISRKGLFHYFWPEDY